MLRTKQKGQSTTEYFILLAMAITVFVVFLRPGGVFQGRIEQTMDDTLDFMNAMVEDVKN